MTKAKMAQIHELWRGYKTGGEIALLPGLCRSMVFRALRKLGLFRLLALKLKPEVQRYEWGRPGDMLHEGYKASWQG